MAAMTYAEMLAWMLVILQDSTTSGQAASNAIYKEAELDLVIPQALTIASRYGRPYQQKHTATTTASSKDITLSTEQKRNLLWIDAVEYKVDLNPRQLRNFERFGDVVTLGIDTLPSASESVYLYLAKRHVLQKAIGTTDTAGAIKTQAAVGATSLALKSLGTGTINENTKLTITGDSTTYNVTATATIAANEATVTIYPALVALATVDAVVTLALADSTMDTEVELHCADYAAGMAACNKTSSPMQECINVIAVLTTASTAIGNMTAQITSALTEIGLANAAADTASTTISTDAGTPLGKIAAEIVKADAAITLAITAISDGEAIINTMPTILGADNDWRQTASADMNLAATEINAGLGYAREAMSLIQQGQAESSLVRDYLGTAQGYLSSGNSYLNQGANYLNKIRTQIQVAGSSNPLFVWGTRKKAEALQGLKGLGYSRTAFNHSRSE